MSYTEEIFVDRERRAGHLNLSWYSLTYTGGTGEIKWFTISYVLTPRGVPGATNVFPPVLTVKLELFDDREYIGFQLTRDYNLLHK